MTSRKTIDVSDKPELRRLAEEVERTGEARGLLVRGREVAFISPIHRPIIKAAEGTRDAHAAFMSSFGGWAGLVDAEALKRASRRSRSIVKAAPKL